MGSAELSEWMCYFAIEADGAEPVQSKQQQIDILKSGSAAGNDQAAANG